MACWSTSFGRLMQSSVEYKYLKSPRSSNSLKHTYWEPQYSLCARAQMLVASLRFCVANPNTAPCAQMLVAPLQHVRQCAHVCSPRATQCTQRMCRESQCNALHWSTYADSYLHRGTCAGSPNAAMRARAGVLATIMQPAVLKHGPLEPHNSPLYQGTGAGTPTTTLCPRAAVLAAPI